jgi:hypothetical protein
MALSKWRKVSLDPFMGHICSNSSSKFANTFSIKNTRLNIFLVTIELCSQFHYARRRPKSSLFSLR